MNNKIILIVSVFLILLGTLVGITSAAEKPEYTLKFATITAKEHPDSIIMDYFLDLIEEDSNGRIKIERYYNCSMGSAREIAEAVKEGTFDFMHGGSGDLSIYAPITDLVCCPPEFYKSTEHAMAVFKLILPQLREIVSKAGFRILAPFYQGTRQIIAKKPIRNFEELQGLRIRVPESPLYIGAFEALGASPTPVAFNEVYTSLQTGLIEAAEGVAASIYTLKWYEPAPYLNLTDHMKICGLLVANEKKYNKLPKDLQEVIQRAADKFQVYANNRILESEQEFATKLEKDGVHIVKINNLTPFRDAVKDFNLEFAKKLGPEAVEIYKKMLKVE